jgi:hypothetical protein
MRQERIAAAELPRFLLGKIRERSASLISEGNRKRFGLGDAALDGVEGERFSHA